MRKSAPLILLPLVFTGACTTSSDDTDPIDTGTPVYETSRRLVHEVFTGSTCGPCEPAEGYIEGVMAERSGQYTSIKYQLGGDPYFTREGYYRRIGYNPDGSTGYTLPWLQLDGSNGHHPNDMDGDEVYDFTDVYTTEWFDTYGSIPSGMSLDVTHSVQGQTVSFEIVLDPLAEYEKLDPYPNLVLHVAIIESVTYNNVGSNGQTEFHHVMKKMVPDHNGSTLSALTRKESQTVEMSYTFNGEYNPDTNMNDPVDHATEHTVESFDNLHVVVFVQDADTLEIHQSAWTME